MATKCILFVDDEPDVLQELQQAFAEVGLGWDVCCATSGPETLRILKQRPVDLIICDLLMPGMNGAVLLAEVKKLYPQTMRIALAGDSEREKPLKLLSPAHQCLTKHSDPALLRGMIRRSFSFFALHDLLSDEKLRRLVSQVHWLPALPSLYLRLLQELRGGQPSMARIGEIISHDPSMTADILRLVNSAFYGLAQKMTNPLDAAVYLGTETLKSLVLTHQAFSQFIPPRVKEFSFDALWQHSWSVGTLAKRIAITERADLETVDECFTAGLLHDLGKMIMVNNLPDTYRAVLTSVQKNKQAIWQAERQVFGADHSGVGAYLLSLWGLPDSVVEAIALHHRPGQSKTPGFSVTVAVHAANCFEYEMSLGDRQHPECLLATEALTSLGLFHRIDLWRQVCEEPR